MSVAGDRWNALNTECQVCAGTYQSNFICAIHKIHKSLHGFSHFRIIQSADIKIPKAKKLGIFRIKQITIDGDGESKIKFDTLKDYVEVDNLNSLPLNSDDVKEFQLMYKADVELESEENEDGEEE